MTLTSFGTTWSAGSPPSSWRQQLMVIVSGRQRQVPSEHRNHRSAVSITGHTVISSLWVSSVTRYYQTVLNLASNIGRQNIIYCKQYISSQQRCKKIHFFRVDTYLSAFHKKISTVYELTNCIKLRSHQLFSYLRISENSMELEH
jgi:hypothetical protein